MFLTTILFIVLSVSNLFAAGTLTVSSTNVVVSTSMTVSWSGVSPISVGDWIGVYNFDAGDGSFRDWFYVSCTRSASVASTAGSCTFNAPSVVGTFNLRLFYNNGYNRLAVSQTFNTTPLGGSPPPIVPGNRLALGDCTIPLTALHVCDDQPTIDGLNPRGIMLDGVGDSLHSGHITIRRAMGVRGNRLSLLNGSGIGAVYTEGYDGVNYLNAGYMLWRTDGAVTPGVLGSVITFAVRDAIGGVFESLAVRGRVGLHTSLETPYALHLSAPNIRFPRMANGQVGYLCISSIGELFSSLIPCR